MAPRSPDKRPDPPTTAVVQVAEDGTSTLYLGSELVEHANGVDSATVIRELVDYAASIGADVRVTTQMRDGTWTRHLLAPDGTLTLLPRNLPPVPTGAGSSRSNVEPPRSQRRAQWSLITKPVLRGWLLAMLLLFVAMLVAVLVMA
jgi:hypothetical protein